MKAEEAIQHEESSWNEPCLVAMAETLLRAPAAQLPLPKGATEFGLARGQCGWV